MNECLLLENYQNLEIKGAKKIVSATANQTVVETETKTIVISGSNLEVVKLDLDNLVVCLSGNVANIKLSSGEKKIGLLKRIFK